jgi:hypothetical protein
MNDDQPESASDGLEELSLGSHLLADFTVQSATEFLQLIDQKGLCSKNCSDVRVRSNNILPARF